MLNAVISLTTTITMKGYLIVLCAVFLTAKSNYDYYWKDKYEPMPKNNFPNDKERDDGFYTGQDNDDLDAGVSSITVTDETKIEVPSYKVKEDDYYIKSCPESTIWKQALADYYWRDYKGIIPDDALPIDENVYVGQVYIKNKGVYVGLLTPGIQKIEVSAYGVQNQDYLIKILCTQHKENFCWLNTTYTTFHDDTKDKTAVVGGYDINNHGELNIGRVVEGKHLNLGGVSSFEPEYVYLWYPMENDDFMALNYEVLMYNYFEIL